MNVKIKLSLFLVSNAVFSLMFINFFSFNLKPVIYDYGVIQCNNVVVGVINYVVDKKINDVIKDNIISQTIDGNLNLNVKILNSINSNVVKESQYLLYELEKGKLDSELMDVIGVKINQKKIKNGIIYEVPISRAFNNLLIGNLGIDIPFKYKLVGQIKGEIVSNVKEYGINNALIEIGILLKYGMQVMIPMSSQLEENEIFVPLIAKLVQGEVPNYILGMNASWGSE